MIKIPRSTKDSLSAFLNIIYPKHCQGCGVALHYKNKFYLCKECFKKIKINKPPFCIKCGRSIYGPAVLKAVCGKCLDIKYNFDRAFSCCNYEGLIKELVHKFKYEHKKYLIRLFDELLVNFVKDYIKTEKIDAIVPVPLHRGKLQQRGFDQSLLLSKNLSRTFNLPVVYNVLERNRDTKQQSDLNKNQRLTNVKCAFSLKDNRTFGGKRILLIDDVATTAATANECAAVLKTAGAGSITLLTLARGQ